MAASYFERGEKEHTMLSAALAGDDPEELELYDRAIEGGLARSNVYYMKGRTLFALGRRQEARAAFKRVIEINDNPEIVGWSKQYIYWIDEE